jgi:hypothetical protein
MTEDSEDVDALPIPTTGNSSVRRHFDAAPRGGATARNTRLAEAFA